VADQDNQDKQFSFDVMKIPIDVNSGGAVPV